MDPYVPPWFGIGVAQDNNRIPHVESHIGLATVVVSSLSVSEEIDEMILSQRPE